MGIDPRRAAMLRRNNAESNAFVRSCIEEALVQLMAAKPFDKITVTDIATRAGVSRNAYYRNYSGKEDILAEYVDGVCAEVSRALQAFHPATQTVDAWRSLLLAAHDFAPRYRLLLQAGYGDLMRQKIRDNQCMPRSGDALADRYVASYWAGAICSVLEDWIAAQEDMELERLAELCATLMQSGLAESGPAGSLPAERQGAPTSHGKDAAKD